MSKGKDMDGAPFVVKTYQLLLEKSNKDLVGFSDSKDSFIVWNPVDFAAEVLPKYFKHNNFCSFIRQLNTYGFHKVESKQWEFKHELFKEGRTDLLKQITRRKSKKRDEREFEENNTEEQGFSQPPAKDIKIARVEKDDKEVGKMQELNNLLMKEVIRLQQQQETTNDTIKQILSELITSRKEQRELTKKVSEIATDPKDSTSKPPTPNSSPLDTNTPSSSLSSPASYSSKTPETPSLFAQIVIPKSEVDVHSYLESALLQQHVGNQAIPQVKQAPFPKYTAQAQYPVHIPSTPMYSQYPSMNTPQHVDYQSQVTNLSTEPVLEAFLNQDDSNFFNLDDLAHLELAPPEQPGVPDYGLEKNYQGPEGYAYNLQ